MESVELIADGKAPRIPQTEEGASYEGIQKKSNSKVGGLIRNSSQLACHVCIYVAAKIYKCKVFQQIVAILLQWKCHITQIQAAPLLDKYIMDLSAPSCPAGSCSCYNNLIQGSTWKSPAHVAQ